MSSPRDRFSKARTLAAIIPRRVFLRITNTESSPKSSRSRRPGGAEIDPVIVIADEQQRRVDRAPLLVDG